MSKWSGAWMIAKRELTSDKWMYVLNLLMCLFIAFYIFSFTMEIQQNENEGRFFFITLFSNIFILLMFQVMGVGFKSSYFTPYYKTDLFTKKVSWLKQMPISNHQIFLSRMIEQTVMLIYSSLLIFGMLALIFGIMKTFELSFIQYLQMMGVWAGYAMLFGSIYLAMEFGVSGKRYFVGSLIISFAFMLITVLISIWIKIPIWHLVITWVKLGGWIAPLISIGIGLLGIFICQKWMQRRLNTRDLYV